MISTSLLLCGFTFIRSGIINLKVEDYVSHGEVELEFDPDASDSVQDIIKEYKKPTWIPEGYSILSEKKHFMEYNIFYQSEKKHDIIGYSQTVAAVKSYLSTENGKHEDVSIGNYFGEFIQTVDTTFLVVTDGIYLYSVTSSDSLNKATLIKIIESSIIE